MVISFPVELSIPSKAGSHETEGIDQRVGLLNCVYH